MEDQINAGDIVTLECTGKLSNGLVFMNPEEDGPLTFEVGKYEVIRGLNKAVLNMGLGEEKTVRLAPCDAFGEYRDDLLIKTPLSGLPPEPQKGMQLKSQDENGEEIIWSVKEVREDDGVAILDGNHLLAGHSLEFLIRVVSIRN